MKLVGAVAVPREMGIPFAMFEFADGTVLGSPVLFYGVVSRENDDAPGRLVPFAEDPGLGGGSDLKPVVDIPCFRFVVYGAYSENRAVEVYWERRRAEVAAE